MVLERKSNLVMPSHYVELDREEMSYVEGGGTITYSFSLTISGSTLKSLLANTISVGLTALVSAGLSALGLSAVAVAVAKIFVSTLTKLFANTILSNLTLDDLQISASLKIWIPFVKSKTVSTVLSF